jgi:hypothetical protein
MPPRIAALHVTPFAANSSGGDPSTTIVSVRSASQRRYSASGAAPSGSASAIGRM